MMQYLLQPTQDDILHYAKGSESKAHKYISRAFKKGRWVYTYAKNKARGNAVTNKDGKKSDGLKYQYSPNIKTTTNAAGGRVLTEPWNEQRYMSNTSNKLPSSNKARLVPLKSNRTTIDQDRLRQLNSRPADNNSYYFDSNKNKHVSNLNSSVANIATSFNQRANRQYSPNVLTMQHPLGEKIYMERGKDGVYREFHTPNTQAYERINKVITDDVKKYGISTFEDIIKRYNLNKK